MDAENAFEFRRAELARAARAGLEKISDQQVVVSFLESVSDGGCVQEYLRLGQLVVVLGETLFVHSQVCGNNWESIDGCAWAVGALPEGDATAGPDVRMSVRQWADTLNRWCSDQVYEWQHNPVWWTPPEDSSLQGWSHRGGSALIAYGTRASPVASVVAAHMEGEFEVFQPLPDDLRRYLAAQGVSRVVVGEALGGACPYIVPDEDVTLVMADTNYSHFGCDLAFSGDDRGLAVCEILIENEACRIHGRTSDGHAIDFSVSGADGDPFVGLVAEVDDGDKVVSAKLRENGEDFYLLCEVSDQGQGLRPSTVMTSAALAEALGELEEDDVDEAAEGYAAIHDEKRSTLPSTHRQSQVWISPKQSSEVF